MAEDGKIRDEIFKDQNHQLWKMQMEDYLYQKDLFLPLDGIKKNSMDMKDEEWEVLDKKALWTIRLSLTASGFQYFKRKDNEGDDEWIG